MKYRPTPQQARWLRRWRETGLPLRGEASVNSAADFAKMQADNVAFFTTWAANLADMLNPNPQGQGAAKAAAQAEEKPKRQRAQKLEIATPEIQTATPEDIILPGDDMELYTREHGQDADG
jgi:hypothetical protein